jgi:Zn finger protein HypA/HybF involved in hydrogenase expression
MSQNMPISDSLHELLHKAIRLAEGRPIRQINAALGALTGLTPEQVQAEFVHHRRGTLAAEARLELAPEPGRALCLSCGQEAAASLPDEVCPDCGSSRRRVVAGQHLSFAGMHLMSAAPSYKRAPAAARRAPVTRAARKTRSA